MKLWHSVIFSVRALNFIFLLQFSVDENVNMWLPFKQIWNKYSLCLQNYCHTKNFMGHNSLFSCTFIDNFVKWKFVLNRKFYYIIIRSLHFLLFEFIIFLLYIILYSNESFEQKMAENLRVFFNQVKLEIIMIKIIN